MKIVGAGFGRTGTASMKAALEHLGFGPCYHMFDVIADPGKMHHWRRAVDGEDMDWSKVFAGYQSTVDWPGCAFWSQIAEAYPESKVLLTVRDPQRWYDSTYKTIYQFYTAETDPAVPAEMSEVFRPLVGKMIWEGTFGGRFEDRDHAIEVFERHNEEVRGTVPASRLLEYEVGSGWEPLCEFLGVDVPDVEFPHVNDSASMPELVERVRAEGKFPSPFG
ncbi:sulfotransferase family protein [Prauserella oleivorans]|uniref:Sulfotransferase family protein n=1 Tax=Prauserella oleivorans TaxID=1478153 RepID=A0ABW5WBC8_9PSEU